MINPVGARRDEGNGSLKENLGYCAFLGSSALLAIRAAWIDSSPLVGVIGVGCGVASIYALERVLAVANPYFGIEVPSQE